MAEVRLLVNKVDAEEMHREAAGNVVGKGSAERDGQQGSLGEPGAETRPLWGHGSEFALVRLGRLVS